MKRMLGFASGAASVAVLGAVVVTAIYPSPETVTAQVSTPTQSVAMSDLNPSGFSAWLRDAHAIAAREGEENTALDTF